MIEEEVQKTNPEENLNPDDLMAMWEAALKESQAASQPRSPEPSQEMTGETVSTSKKETTPTQPLTLQELTTSKEPETLQELDFILDIPLEISVEIGRTKMLIKDLLKLSQGSIIELEKMAGEPVDVFVNGKFMAKGEVVVVNDRFGVRITEILSTKDRVKRLGS